MVHTFQSIWKEVNNPVVIPPNCKGSLLRWRIITKLISKCPSEVQQRISKLDTCCPEHIEPNIWLSNTHFHLYQIHKMFHTWDFKALEHNITSGTNLPVLHAAITNFIFPSSWDNIHLEDPWLFYTIGLHPHLVGTININPSFFITHLQNLRCVGIGEIGLDYMTRCTCYPNHHSLSKESCTKKKIQQQHQFLHTLLPQIPASTPIVIHTNGQNAVNDMIGFLLEFKKNQQPIHWHCFTGNTELVKQLTATFSNITISLSSHSIQNVKTWESLWYIPSSNLILESDATYLDSLSQKLNSPWTIPGHASQITKYKNIPVSLLYEISLQNLIDLYHLPFILLPTMAPPISTRE